MKQTLFLLAAVFTIGLLNSNALYGETVGETHGKMLAQADTSKSSDWDALFDDDQPAREHRGPRGDGFGPPNRRQRGGEFDRGPRRGPGPDDRGYGRGDGRGGGRGGFGPRGGRGGGRGGQIDPQELMEFLYKYEPQLAQKLEILREENPRKVRRHIRRLSHLYAPVMRQMERNPEMGKLSLRRMRLHLRVKNQLRQSKKEGATIDSVQLRKNVAELYDVILTQEELWGRQTTARMERWGKSEGQDWREGSDRGKGKMQEGRQRLEEMETSIKAWRSNKEKIIDSHIQRLQRGVKPFPWGRM